MKKLLLVLAVAVNGILNAQIVTETKSVDKIVETFQSIDGMVLSASKLDQLYSDLSKLTFSDDVLFSKTSYFNNTNVLNVYGNNNVFKTTNFLADQQDRLVMVSVDLSNVTSTNRLQSSTQINISIFYRNDLGNLTQNYVEVHIRNGSINYINELTDTLSDSGSAYFIED